MDSAASDTRRRPEPSFAELFTPKLITLLREGYSAADFRADALAGLTVAIVVLPLSMAIAIGSGLSPEKGLLPPSSVAFSSPSLGGAVFKSAVRQARLSS